MDVFDLPKSLSYRHEPDQGVQGGRQLTDAERLAIDDELLTLHNAGCVGVAACRLTRHLLYTDPGIQFTGIRMSDDCVPCYEAPGEAVAAYGPERKA